MTQSFETGTEFRAAPRRMTRERMRWYVDAQPTIAADDGRIHTQPPTIHDDDEYAKSQGLPGIIADGMISTNWIQSLLIDTFGPTVAKRSRLRTKYVRPVYEDDMIHAIAQVTKVEGAADAPEKVELKVWCEREDGTTVTAGEAIIHLA